MPNTEFEMCKECVFLNFATQQRRCKTNTKLAMQIGYCEKAKPASDPELGTGMVQRKLDDQLQAWVWLIGGIESPTSFTLKSMRYRHRVFNTWDNSTGEFN